MSNMDDRGMIRHFATLVAVALGVLLFCAPLPFGSVTRWGAAAVQTAAFSALALAAITARSRDVKTVAAPVLALCAVAVLGLLQSFGWPRMLVSLVSSGHAELRSIGASGASGASGTGGASAAGSWVPLSLAPDVSAATALTWAAVAAVLVASTVAARRHSRRRWLAAAIVGAAVFQLAYGSGRWMSGSAEIWGTAVPGDPSRLRGTFVNPDHLAAYLEIALAITFAWGWWGFRRASRPLTAIERRVLLTVPPVVVWLALFLGLAFTGSRGGLAAAVVAVVAQGLLLARAARRRGPAAVGVLAVLAGVGVVAAAGLQKGFGRLAETSVYEVTWNSRRQMYAATWELWHRFPLLGAGLGAFRDAISLTQPDDLPGTWWHAHSDWLELLATMGIVGAAIFLAGLTALVIRLARGWASNRRSEDRAAVLAALGALVSLAIHESIDFGLTMPAIAITLAALLGTAAVACGVEEALPEVNERQPAGGPSPEPEPRPRRPRSPTGRVRFGAAGES